jgi:uncharacterized protein YndB with AHSA1/START domain
MTTSTTDRIEKSTVLDAPRARVWRAITDSKEFGAWFKCEFTEPFNPGAVVKGRITYPGYEGVPLEIWIERMEPERLFSYRWHPGEHRESVDLAKEPTTLVEFRLDVAPGGSTRLTVTESGFDQLPIARRAAALKSNEGGWAEQMKFIAEYLRTHS